MYELTSRYRTVHSIKDKDVTRILELAPPDARTILDFGCHLGHLSFELAIRFPATIYAVDNFRGTPGDARMASTIRDLTGGDDDFHEQFQRNMEECRSESGGFRGEVIAMRSEEFMQRALPGLTLDLAFIDSSHREEDAWEFGAIAARVRAGGILGGHDNDEVHSAGVVRGIESIAGEFEWIDDAYTWFMRKRIGAAVDAA